MVAPCRHGVDTGVLTMSSVDVLIAGAGPAGSALAAALAGGGASVLLVEAATHPRPKACAEYASPRIAEELARLGVAGGWTDAAVRLRGMDLHAGGRAVSIRYADAAGARDAWGVDRRSFDAILAGHAARAGAELRERTRLVDLVVDGSRVRGATVRDQLTGREEVVSAGWTVGADGTRSSVSRLVGADRPVRFPRRLGLVAHYAGVPELTDHGEMHVRRRAQRRHGPADGRPRSLRPPALRRRHRRPAGGCSTPRGQLAADADSRGGADRPPSLESGRSGLAPGRGRGGLR
jgi:flavin-dependent dehydrogenase